MAARSRSARRISYFPRAPCPPSRQYAARVELWPVGSGGQNGCFASCRIYLCRSGNVVDLRGRPTTSRDEELGAQCEKGDAIARLAASIERTASARMDS